MNLPVPNAEEVSKMRGLYFAEFGVELSRDEAFEALSQVAQLIYLLEYEPIRPLRAQEPGRRGQAAAVHPGPSPADDGYR